MWAFSLAAPPIVGTMLCSTREWSCSKNCSPWHRLKLTVCLAEAPLTNSTRCSTVRNIQEMLRSNRFDQLSDKMVLFEVHLPLSPTNICEKYFSSLRSLPVFHCFVFHCISHLLINISFNRIYQRQKQCQFDEDIACQVSTNDKRFRGMRHQTSEFKYRQTFYEHSQSGTTIFLHWRK